jgi:hypothetical protein
LGIHAQRQTLNLFSGGIHEKFDMTVAIAARAADAVCAGGAVRVVVYVV